MMSQVLWDLLNLLNVEKIDDTTYRGQCEDLGLRQVFGGQIVAQALSAARQCVPIERDIHSYHSYFIRPGDSKLPIIYHVELLRDGKSFSTRYVSASQNHTPIFYMTASFHISEEGFVHQNTIPRDILLPEQLVSETEIAHKMAHLVPENIRSKFTRERALDIRTLGTHSPFKQEITPPQRYSWLKANGQMPQDPCFHQYLLSYASDFHFLPTTLQPHGKGFLEADMQVATLDHAMWFHRPFRLDDWVLYMVESPSASGARGFVQGQFYTRQGELVASTAQEGLIRQHRQ